jgi:homoserine kinase
VRVRVPASSANLGPAFDSVGLALGLWDEYSVVVTDGGGLRIRVVGEGAADVPKDASHLVHQSMASAFRQLGVGLPPDVDLMARNGIPHGRGLGSSASAIVAGVSAAHALCALTAKPEVPGGEVPLDLRLVSDLSSELEGHPDNASASVYGGMTLSWTIDCGEPDAGRTGTARIQVHPDVTAVLLVAPGQLATHHARSVLPRVVGHREAALNSGRSALLIEAVTRRPDLLLPATRDWLHQEPRRASFAESMAAVDALRAGGHAAVISGAGPSILVLTTRERAADVVAPGGLVGRGDWQRLEPGIPERGVEAKRL